MLYFDMAFLVESLNDGLVDSSGYSRYFNLTLCTVTDLEGFSSSSDDDDVDFPEAATPSAGFHSSTSSL